MNKARVSTSLIPLFAAVPAGAQVMFTSANETITPGGTTVYNWNIDGEGGAEFQIFTGSTGISIKYLTSNAEIVWSGSLKNFNTTESVSSAAGSFADVYISVINASNLAVPHAQNFTDGVGGFIGFRFDSGGSTHYGWANITLNSGGNFSMNLHSWAWEGTADTAIKVGAGSAVPEPAAAATGLGLLALGAAGLRRQRWLKRQAA